MQQLKRAAENFITNEETLEAINHSCVCHEATENRAGFQEELDTYMSPPLKVRRPVAPGSRPGYGYGPFPFSISLSFLIPKNKSNQSKSVE